MGRLSVVVGMLSACMFASRARALPNDLQIYQLRSTSTPTCFQPSVCDPNSQERFRMLGDELGMALNSTTLEPANTVGVDGFDFAFETAIVFINSGEQIGGQPYWVTQNVPPAELIIPSVHFRKGLPYSFEFEGRVSVIGDSGMFAGQIGLKWGILEGFRYAPDLSARFAMTRLFGQTDFDSTSGVIDATLGKEFGIAGLFTLTPYIGYAATGVDSSPRVIWGNPNTTQQSYEASPIADQELFAEAKWNDNLYDRFYGGLQATIYIVSLNVEYDYSRPSGFSGQAFQVSPALSTIGLRLALTL